MLIWYYPVNDDDGRTLQQKRDRNEMLEDFIAAYHYLKPRKDCNGKVGVVGFCFGGWISNMMAVKAPSLGSAVPYYGREPSNKGAIKIKAPLLLQSAGLDKRVNTGWPAFEEVFKKIRLPTKLIFPQKLIMAFITILHPNLIKSRRFILGENHRFF